MFIKLLASLSNEEDRLPIVRSTKYRPCGGVGGGGATNGQLYDLVSISNDEYCSSEDEVGIGTDSDLIIELEDGAGDSVADGVIYGGGEIEDARLVEDGGVEIDVGVM